MKQFFALALIAGALMITSPGQASMVASKSQCLASCGSAISTSCGWITKPGRFNRCRTHLIKQCRKFGTDVMCPTAPPPAPPVTTTTVPAPVVTTTTTTVPYVPPTTTTLPPPPPVYNPWTGTWNWYGTLTDDTCPPGVTSPYQADTFYVVQNGTSFTAQAATLGSGVVFTGGLDSDGGFTIEASGVYIPGDPLHCVVNFVLTVSPVGTVIESSDPAWVARTAYCPTFTCTSGWAGSVSY